MEFRKLTEKEHEKIEMALELIGGLAHNVLYPGGQLGIAINGCHHHKHDTVRRMAHYFVSAVHKYKG